MDRPGSSTSVSTSASRPGVPPGTPSWVTAELIERTQKIWGKRSGKAIGPDEALGMILRVGNLFDVLSGR
jgi:hypothetical protein